MTSERECILGTRVPDTAIHRASLWLEDLKFGDREDAGPEALSTSDAERFIAALGLPVTSPELYEAMTYYAANFQDLLLGRLDVVVMTPAGPVNLAAILGSVWFDGFQHGAATVAGKRGLSHRERDLGREV